MVSSNRKKKYLVASNIQTIEICFHLVTSNKLKPKPKPKKRCNQMKIEPNLRNET